jgi:hypothetical protein
MKIQLWNAFASNNSGSYTIVGSFHDPALVAKAVDLLKPVLEAHDAWYAAPGMTDIAESPLARFAVSQGLPVDCVDHEWPQYHEPTLPSIIATDHQLLIHHSYTASMPRFFGYWIYALGGRVTTELNHAHAPLIAIHDIFMPWNLGRSNRDQGYGRLHAELSDPAAPFRSLLVDPASVRLTLSAQGNGLRLLAVFGELADGCAAVRAVTNRHGATMIVGIREAEGDDPLSGIGNISE